MDRAQQLAYENNRRRQGRLAVNLGLVVNVLLAGLKTTIGILGHSPALLADGINAITDTAYYVVVSVFVRLADKPADEDHPYGHNQLESIAVLVVGSFVITTAIAIFWESINRVFDLLSGGSVSVGASSLALIVALATVAIKVVLSWFTNRIGVQTNNPLVCALALDHRNDVFTAAGAALGIFLGRAGYPWVDPLAGAVVALVIARTGIRILQDSTSDLMDTLPAQPLSDQIMALLCPLEGVYEVEEIKAHRFGPYLVVNITIGIDGSLTVAKGDRIASRVEEILMENIPHMRRVHVHYHPTRLAIPSAQFACRAVEEPHKHY